MGVVITVVYVIVSILGTIGAVFSSNSCPQYLPAIVSGGMFTSYVIGVLVGKRLKKAP